MTAEITSNQRRAQSERYFNGCKCFVNCNATKIADKFFTENEIYKLNFKCKTWAAVCKVTTKLCVEALKTVLPKGCIVKYARNAGCSCGCSPGYNVTNIGHSDLYNTNLHVEVTVDTTEFEAMMPLFKVKLDKEIKLNNELCPV